MNTGRKGLLLILLLVFMLVGPLAPRPAHALGTSRLVNLNSGLCLDDAGWSTNWGTPMIQYACTGGSNQQWSVYYHYGNNQAAQWVVLQNVYSGLCLRVFEGKTTTYGQIIVQWGCDSNDLAQNLFQTESLQSGCNLTAFQYQSVYIPGAQPTGFMMEVYHASRSNGGKVDIWYTNGTRTQFWCGLF